MVKILAALSILNSSGATEKVAAIVARATCSGASHSSAQNVYGIVSVHGAIVKITENRVIVNVHLQELCYILLVMNL